MELVAWIDSPIGPASPGSLLLGFWCAQNAEKLGVGSRLMGYHSFLYLGTVPSTGEVAFSWQTQNTTTLQW